MDEEIEVYGASNDTVEDYNRLFDKLERLFDLMNKQQKEAEETNEE